MYASTDPVFVACWSVGAGGELEGVFFLEAVAWPEGHETALIPPTWLRPYRHLPEDAPLPRRLHELGYPSAPAPPAAALALPLLFERLAARPLILASGRAEFLRLFRACLPAAEPPVALDLEALAQFLHPYRGERTFEALFRRFALGEPAGAPRAADLRRATVALMAAHWDRPQPLLQLLARAVDELLAHAGDRQPAAVEGLELLRRLLDRPSRYAGGADQDLFRAPLADGRLSEQLEAAPLDFGRALRELRPRFQREFEEGFATAEELPARLDGPAALAVEDRAILATFYDLVPKAFARTGAEPRARPGQRALAEALLESLEHECFLLADAPTGTGKTLAYLGPLLLWSAAKGVQVAVSTYTRALQEQAYFREVPRALELLARAGLPPERMPRVSMLKGRGNYICGRALAASAAEAGEGSLAARATWLRLVLYFLEDPTADLDGFPLDCGLPLADLSRAQRAQRAAVDSVRALPRCCEGQNALSCAAGVRRLRAERSHLVVTNHAFVLARPDRFAQVLFDECDHLHEVAVGARSYAIDLDELEAEAQRLTRSRGRDRSPLERWQRLLAQRAAGDAGAELSAAAAQARHGAQALDALAHALARDLRAFRAHREQAGAARSPEERAFLLHEYLHDGRGDQLLTDLQALRDALGALDLGLRGGIEQLGQVPLRQAQRLRWTLRAPLDRLAHWREALDLWLGSDGADDAAADPQARHRPFLLEAVFEGQRRKPALSLKWLLPQVWLGEDYYPSLRWAGLVSATAKLRGGFAAMKGYLGLDLFEQGGAERPARPLATFSGPPTFDPAAALVCVPNDAPAYAPSGAGFDAWSEYVERFLVFLAERTRGRLLGLFTNRGVLARVAERLREPFAERGLTLYWQGMPGLGKEEIMERFRARVDSVLLGLDTFWYGVDFPGETCQYVVVTKLPYGALDDYHYAQQARMGAGAHRSRVYLPRALAMFRQGCGRLLRSEDDRGAIFLLDRRVLEGRHGAFLAELPRPEGAERPPALVADTDTCLQRAFAHMQLGGEIERRRLRAEFSAGARPLDPPV